MSGTAIRAFVGVDRREPLQARICIESLRDCSSVPVIVTELRLDELEACEIYWRPYRVIGAQMHDLVSGTPQSTEFTFARYLVPALTLYQGAALFCDHDLLWRDDPADLWACFDDRFAIQVAKQTHEPAERSKLRGVEQDTYPRKNWSSVALWNCGHPAHRWLVPDNVNSADRSTLHGLRWLQDQQIGELAPGWNWIEGVTPPDEPAHAVHFTHGTPDMPGCESAAYGDEWLRLSRSLAAAA